MVREPREPAGRRPQGSADIILEIGKYWQCFAKVWTISVRSGLLRRSHQQIACTSWTKVLFPNQPSTIQVPQREIAYTVLDLIINLLTTGEPAPRLVLVESMHGSLASETEPYCILALNSCSFAELAKRPPLDNMRLITSPIIWHSGVRTRGGSLKDVAPRFLPGSCSMARERVTPG